MIMHADVRAALLAHPPLVALIGQRAAAHVATEGWPFPYVIWRITEQPDLGLSGERLGAVATVEAQCWATNALAASAVADAVEAALAGMPAAITSRATGSDEDGNYDFDTVTAVMFTD